MGYLICPPVLSAGRIMIESSCLRPVRALCISFVMLGFGGLTCCTTLFTVLLTVSACSESSLIGLQTYLDEELFYLDDHEFLATVHDIIGERFFWRSDDHVNACAEYAMKRCKERLMFSTETQKERH